MRTITGQKDYGLEPVITITADDRDDFGGGTSNHYSLTTPNPSTNPHADARVVLCQIQFQHGPRNDTASKPGIADSDLLHVLIDRYEGFQSGPFACEENEVTLQLLLDTLASTRVRADRRQNQGVLGQNEPHVTPERDRLTLRSFSCSGCGKIVEQKLIEYPDLRTAIMWECCGGKPDIRFDAVESSNVHSIGYNADTSELHVRFKSKDAPTHYVYANVSSEVHEALLNADSVGKYLAASVKNRYECRKVSA